MIEIINVTKIIKEKEVLKNINLELENGKIYLLKGHNGCGKTMLLRLICGFIKATKGEIKYEKNYSFGVIIENPAFFLHETGFYNLKYLADINKKIDDELINDELKKFGLYDVKDRKVKTYSLGMRQRLAICQAFMENPDVILLDEPFNAIDEENLNIVFQVLREEKKKNKIIVIASHGEVTSLKFDKIIKMSDGRIIKNK